MREAYQRYVDRLRGESYTKWGLQIVRMTFQKGSSK